MQSLSFCLQTLRLHEVSLDGFPENVGSNLINLRHLQIKFILSSEPRIGVMNWISSFRNIAEISLDACINVTEIPPLERLPFLKLLNMQFLPNLKCIYFEEAAGGTLFFPSLEIL